MKKELMLIDPLLTVEEIIQSTSTAKEGGYASICILPLMARHVYPLLEGTDIKLSTVIGFPFGHMPVEAKLSEIVLAMVDGVEIFSVIINLPALLHNDWQYLAGELNAIMPVLASKNKTLRIVIEAGLLSEDQLMKCCDLYGIAGIHVLESHTGFYYPAPGNKALEQMRSFLTDQVLLKTNIRVENDNFDLSTLPVYIGQVGITTV